MASKPPTARCPSCGRKVGVYQTGTVRRHKPLAGAVVAEVDGWCPGGEVDPPAGNVTKLRPRQSATMTDAERAAANRRRAPAHALELAPHKLCGARLMTGDRDTGVTCKQVKGYGTDHPGYGACKRHGGTTPNGKKHAALERARTELARVKGGMTFYGRRLQVDPEQALLEEMQRTAGAVRWLEAVMAEWGEFERLTAEMQDTDPRPRDELEQMAEDAVERVMRTIAAHEHGGASTRVTHQDERTGLPSLIAVHSTDRAVGFTDTEYAAWMKVYREERRHLVACAKACIDAGIAERRQAVLEARAQMLRAVLLHALAAAGVKLPEEQQLQLIAAATKHVAEEGVGA